MTLPPFEQVVAEHGQVVLRVCRAVVGRDDAEDAWSDTFLAALRAYPRLRPDSDVRRWLVTIAHRKAVDCLRRAARQALPVDPLPERSSGATAVADAALHDEELWAAVAALPPKQRSTVAYHHLAGLPYAEVAALVGGTEVAARRSAADGIAALRRALDLRTATGEPGTTLEPDPEEER